jgi:hypothetical protein
MASATGPRGVADQRAGGARFRRTAPAHRAIFATDVSPPVTARDVRVEKTDPEYFLLAEVRVHGKPGL